jgi:uncharacterized UPF0160 family protein
MKAGRMKNEKIARSCGTHDGTFHADEVTACALLLLFNRIDKDKIIRTRNMEKLEKCEYVCDVGGVYDPSRKLFDHHQAEYQGDLSSAGMVLLYLKNAGLIDEKAYHFFNRSLILGVDAHDNGKDVLFPGICTYSLVVSNFAPIPYDADDNALNEAFFKAVDFAYTHLHQMWQRYQYMQSCRQVVADAMEPQHECLIFDKGIPWLEIFFELNGANHPAKFVVMPSGKHWKLRAIPPTIEERMKVRHPLPQEWAGLLDEELKKVSGIPGAIFCHKGRFISVWETQEDALKALEYTLRKAESKL